MRAIYYPQVRKENKFSALPAYTVILNSTKSVRQKAPSAQAVPSRHYMKKLSNIQYNTNVSGISVIVKYFMCATNKFLNSDHKYIQRSVARFAGTGDLGGGDGEA